MAEIGKAHLYLAEVQESKIFSYLTETELEEILPLAEIVLYEKDEEIIRQGDISEYFFAVIRGTVKVTVKELTDDEVFICSISEGEMFGEAAIFMAEKRTANIISVGNVILLRIHRKNMMVFLRQNPRAGNKILMLIILSLLKKLKNANEELAFEKQPEIDFDYVDALVKDFIKEVI